MRWKTTLWVLGILTAVVVTAVLVMVVRGVQQRHALQDRLSKSRDVNQVTGGPVAGNEYAWEVRKGLFDALSVADVKSLRKPVIAVCAEYNERNQFMVQWLQDEPNAESVQLLSQDGRVLWTATIGEEYRRFNREHTETGVVFHAMFSIPADDPAALKVSEAAVQAVLLKDGRRVSAPVEVMRMRSRPSTRPTK